MMSIDSKIYLHEKVVNSKRRTSGAKEYYPVVIIDVSYNGHAISRPALFTLKALDEAMGRAMLQPEDAPSAKLGLFERSLIRLLSWLENSAARS